MREKPVKVWDVLIEPEEQPVSALFTPEQVRNVPTETRRVYPQQKQRV